MSIVLQVNFIPGAQQETQSQLEKLESARAIAGLAGLLWKVWLQDEATGTRGGIYLFDSLENARAWGDGQLVKRLSEAGATKISIRYFDVNEEASLITHAPLHAALKAA